MQDAWAHPNAKTLSLSLSLSRVSVFGEFSLAVMSFNHCRVSDALLTESFYSQSNASSSLCGIVAPREGIPDPQW